MNAHGLDARYFKEKLWQLVRDADNYTPVEMHLALTRLAEVADSQANDVATWRIDRQAEIARRAQKPMQAHSFD